MTKKTPNKEEYGFMFEKGLGGFVPLERVPAEELFKALEKILSELERRKKVRSE